MTNVTTQELDNFQAQVQAIVDQYRNDGSPLPVTISYEISRRYAKFIASDASSRSVYCFVDIENGSILKADSWKKPARGIRGNIRQANLNTAITPYGAAYAYR